MNRQFFSESYEQARARFRESVRAVSGSLASYQIGSVDSCELTIDVCVIGPSSAPAIVTSSGVHGVEGFFGSAAQLAYLDCINRTTPSKDLRYVLIHAVNPFGFSQLRRFNEENIDLNRNFLGEQADYSGAPESYSQFHRLLNPASAPSGFEFFKLKALWTILRYGMQRMKQAVAGGQYEYPNGIFFGGHEASQSMQVIKAHCREWLADSPRIVHVDFHSGLGKFAAYSLLMNESGQDLDSKWYTDAFGSSCVESLNQGNGTAYRVSGAFGQWMQAHFRDREYRMVGAEFGTYGVLRVLEAIHFENRCHHYAEQNSAVYRKAKAELLESFCPSSSSWRDSVIQSSLRILKQAEDAILSESARA